MLNTMPTSRWNILFALMASSSPVWEGEGQWWLHMVEKNLRFKCCIYIFIIELDTPA